VVDLVIKNGKILLEGSLTNGGLAVDNGVIVLIAKDPKLPSADKVYDAGGKTVLPGFIDLHVHFRDPGYPEREDFFTGTAAAAAGGFSCVGDMPNPRPPTTSVEALLEKRKTAEAKALVDFALYGGTGTKNILAIHALVRLGVRAFKTYMTSTYEDLATTSYGSLLDVLELVSSFGLPLMVHAEDQSILDFEKEKVGKTGLKGFKAHANSRPPIAEEIAATSALLTAGYVGAHLYLCHISCVPALEAVRRAKMKGVRVTAETCPHYLLLTKKDGEKLGPYAKTNPPLRSRSDMEALWTGLRDGTIDVVSSDHCPYTKEEKDVGWEDIFDARPGMPGLDTSIPLMLTQVNRGSISLEKLVELYSGNPAKTLGIYPKKGALLIGSDADITVVDLAKEEVIKRDKLYTKSKMTMFEGFKVKGIPIATFVRGELVMQDHEIVGKPGHGKFV
jgi:allantoinase